MQSTPAMDSTKAIPPLQPANVEAHDSALLAEELKLPPLPSLAIVLFANVLMQLTFFIIVSSSNEYAQHLGGTSTFSGLVIGIPTAIAAITLLPLMFVDKGVYNLPIHFACGSMVLGNVLYALAYKANWLYLILIGRMVSGMGFTFWMYAKKYCSDSRIVGLRRRTTLAGWQVLGQGIGFSLGPFLGGLLSKINFNNSVFNGFTAPGWLMAACWLVFWTLVAKFFQDVPLTPPPQSIPLQPMQEPVEPTPDTSERSLVRHAFHITPKQWAVNATMAWWAMTSFFLLGSWESNIPVFTSSDAPANPFHFTPFSAGNLIALGGACTIPFLLLNLHYGRRMQDRNTLVIGSAIGMVGLLIAMSIIAAQKVNYGSFFVAWFLVALGFNVTSTVTIALLSKQLPSEWNGRISLFIQWSNYTGRVTGAVWGGAGVKVGMASYVGLQIAYVGLGSVLYAALWRHLKAKTG